MAGEVLNVTFAIASGGTVSSTPVIPATHRLVGLRVPTVDSATLTVSLAEEPGASFLATADSAGTANGAIGGSANTGGKYLQVPDALSRLTSGRAVKITMGAAQNSGAVSIVGICAPIVA